MMLLYSIAFFFGTIIGSFLNVLIIRGNTGRSIGGRSGCMSCGVQLTWRDLVPIISYTLLGGKCRTCGSGISLQYPVVELLAGILGVVALFFAQGIAHGILLFVLCMLLLFIAVYDMRHTIIPDTAVVLVALVGAVYIAAEIFDGDYTYARAWTILLSILVASGPFLFVWALSRGRAMGFGDVKLAAAMGVFLVPATAAAFVWLSFVIGGVVGGLFLLLQHVATHSAWLRTNTPALTIKSEVPFGPFLVVAFLIVLLYHTSIFDLLYFFAL